MNIIAGPPPSNGNKITTILKFSKQFKIKFNKSKFSTTCLSNIFKQFKGFKHVKMFSMHDFGISSYVAFVIVDLLVFGYSSVLITSEITIFHMCLRTPDVVRNPALNTYIFFIIRQVLCIHQEAINP